MLLVHFNPHYYYCLSQLNKLVSPVKIPCECGRVYVGETGGAMQERIKEHDRETRLARTHILQTEENNGHAIWNEVKLIYRDPH